MSSKEGTSSSSNGGSSGNGGNQQSKNVSEGKKYVKKKLGLVEKKAGPMDYLQKGKTTGMYASKLTGTKGGTGFYGQEASKATDDYLVETGQVKVGSYFKKEGGNFIRISKSEGERLYAAGDPSISRSTIGGTKSKELKYGKSDSAMGSGDPTGIMTSTAISQPMHKRQQKIKAMALAALSFAAPMPVSSLLRLGAMESYGKMGQAGYSQYLDKFYSNVAGTTSSYGIKSKGTGNGKEQEVSSVNINETRTDTKKSVSDETRFTSLKAVTKGGGTVTDADRTLLKRSGKTIKAGIVST